MNSWGRLRITFDAFTKLIATYRVSPAFLDYVLSFGAKINDVDGNIGGYSRQCHYEFSNDGPEGEKRMVSYGESPKAAVPRDHDS